VNGQVDAPAALPPRYPLDRRLGGPHSRSAHCPHSESNSNLSQSGALLYRLSYRGSSKYKYAFTNSPRSNLRFAFMETFDVVQNCGHALPAIWTAEQLIGPTHALWDLVHGKRGCVHTPKYCTSLHEHKGSYLNDLAKRSGCRPTRLHGVMIPAY
jgi:hypothetical protein